MATKTNNTKTKATKATKAAPVVQPFGEGSVVADAFLIACEGTTRDALVAFAEKKGQHFSRIFWSLGLEEYSRKRSGLQVTWKFHYDRETGEVKITDVRDVTPKPSVKESKAAPAKPAKAPKPAKEEVAA